MTVELYSRHPVLVGRGGSGDDGGEVGENAAQRRRPATGSVQPVRQVQSDSIGTARPLD